MPVIAWRYNYTGITITITITIINIGHTFVFGQSFDSNYSAISLMFISQSQVYVTFSFFHYHIPFPPAHDRLAYILDPQLLHNHPLGPVLFTLHSIILLIYSSNVYFTHPNDFLLSLNISFNNIFFIYYKGYHKRNQH